MLRTWRLADGVLQAIPELNDVLEQPQAALGKRKEGLGRDRLRCFVRDFFLKFWCFVFGFMFFLCVF